MLRESIRICESNIAKDQKTGRSLPHLRIERGRDYCVLGQVLAQSARPAEAETQLRKSREILGELVSQDPANQLYQRMLADSLDILANFLRGSGGLEEALSLKRQVLRIYEGVVATLSDQRAYRLEQFSTRRSLVGLLQSLGRIDEAESFCRESIESVQQLMAADQGWREYPVIAGHALWDLAAIHAAIGRLEDEQKDYARALGVFEKAAADFPQWTFARQELGYTHWKIGWMYERTHRSAVAETSFRNGLAIYRDLHAEHPRQLHRQRVALGYRLLAENLVKQGKHAKAAEITAALIEAFPKSYNNLSAAARYLESCVRLAAAANAPFDAYVRDEGSILDRAIALKSNDAHKAATAYLARAKFHRSRGESEPAKNDLLQSLKFATTALNEAQKPARYVVRGVIHAEFGQWQQAADDFSTAADASNNASHWYFAALARLRAENSAGYRDTCAAMLGRVSTSNDAVAAHWVAWSCVLAPSAVEDSAGVVERARQAVAAQASDQYALTLGAAYYRAERFSDAVEQLHSLCDKPELAEQISPAYAWYLLAMAEYRRGNNEQAKAALQQAIDHHDQEVTSAVSAVSWNRRLTLQLFRDEAQSLLTGDATTPVVAKKPGE